MERKQLGHKHSGRARQRRLTRSLTGRGEEADLSYMRCEATEMFQQGSDVIRLMVFFR